MVLDTESKYWNKFTFEYNYVEELDCSEDENSMIMHVLPTYDGLPKVPRSVLLVV